MRYDGRMRAAVVGWALLAIGCGRDSTVLVDATLMLDDAFEPVPLDARVKPAFPVECDAGVGRAPMPDPFENQVHAGTPVAIEYSYDPMKPSDAGAPNRYTFPMMPMKVVVDAWTFTPKAGTSCTVTVTHGAGAARDAVVVLCPTAEATPPLDNQTHSIRLSFEGTMLVDSTKLPSMALESFDATTTFTITGMPWKVEGPIHVCE